jgi:2-oxoglutarate dehydrogenase E2 component (dihydrolipoamide succinyltransferase)
MILEIKVPSPGESITEVEIGKWLVGNNALVIKDQEITEIESDKATLTLTAPAAGKLTILLGEGERVAVGSIICTLNTEEVARSSENNTAPINKELVEKTIIEKPNKTQVSGLAKPETPISIPNKDNVQIKLTPAAKAVMKEEGLSIDELLSGLHRISRKEVESVIALRKLESVKPRIDLSRGEERVEMSPLRKKLSQRLVAIKNETAMLTTFNEIDMSQLLELRKTYQQPFLEKYGFKLGFMSFFTKAVSVALFGYPSINSMIDGEDIVTPHYHDIGIAVQTPKGLMVPVIRNAETKEIMTIEQEIKELAEKAKNKKLTLQEMTGGTFTITNGGVYGSLMSTPIINPPQSAILGMHAIKERPIAVNGMVEIRPMMYVALSYDHRIIDGKDSVGFLLKIKELIEEPSKILFNGKNPDEMLLGL